MTYYSILRQESPKALPQLWQPGFLFNDIEHVQQQHDGLYYCITALNESTQKADARCTFFIKPDGAISPAAAPFGSIEFSPTLPASVLTDLLEAVIDTARTAGSPLFRIVHYPHCYAPDQSHHLTNVLTARNFRIVESNQTSFLAVTNQPFESGLCPSERRRLRKCQRHGFRFRIWDEAPATEIVRFISESRQQQGYHLTINPLSLIHLLQAFPDQFPVFIVEAGQSIAALTIAVRVRTDILYNFLPASQPGYQSFSPMVMLTHGLYTYCQQQAIRLLDLGVSLDNDQCPKPGLMRFKRNLGAHESPKLVFEKQL